MTPRRTLPLLLVLALGGALWLPAADRAAEPPRRPRSPEEARRGFHLPAGLRLELVAAEPDITSPVDMAFDEDGRLWVMEMRDYPNGPARGQAPEGRVRVLEDRDGDGRFEHSRIFADRLLFGNGLLPWKGGVVVTAAPHILLLSDTDGDGKADRREVLYEGFVAKNPQLRVSHPTLGPDGWIYVANGLLGGRVRRPGRPDAAALDIGGMDFRFDLVHDRHETVTGMGQFGNTFDEAGRRFVCDNRHPLRHVVVASSYLRRNPYLAAGLLLQDTTAPPGQAVEGDRVYPLSRNWTTSNLHAGTFTAACGVHVYLGDLLPADYRGNAFTCDPTGNLVHREVLMPAGATFSSRPGRKGVEFLATADDWCRPVSLAEGPDGALYVVDMYRAVIEHPEFMPPELQHRPDLLLGKDHGRIWRIVPEKGTPSRPRPRLSRASTAELVALLTHPGAWWRTTAQRLLLERRDRTAVEPLGKLCREAAQPTARIQAAWLLQSFEALEPGLVVRLLADPDARVRETALVLGERWLPRSEAIQSRTSKLAEDPDARVRFQAALSLGAWDDDRIGAALAAVAVKDAGDPWARLAVCSAVPRRSGLLLGRLLHADSPFLADAGPGRRTLVQELAALAGARQDAGEVIRVLEVLAALTGPERPRWQMAGLMGLADGMGRRGQQLGAFLRALPAAQRASVETAERLLAQAAVVAADRGQALPTRLDAVRLLAHLPPKTAVPLLGRLMKEDPIPEIRLAAVRSLAAQPGTEVSDVLLKDWAGTTPAVRREVVEALLRQPDRVVRLLDEIEARRIAAADLDSLAQQRLRQHPRPELRTRAGKLLASAVPQERRKVLAEYRRALERKGDAGRGREVFRRNCATCHQVAGIGVSVGPDVSDTRTKSAEMLLGDILNPNAAIDANYVGYTVVTRAGKEITGLIVAESAASVTLRRAEAQTETVLRQDIDEIRSSGVSLMPEGLEKSINVEQMADLLAFLKNWRYLDGQTPLGKEP